MPAGPGSSASPRRPHDVTLAYVPPAVAGATPPWPVLEHIDAGLVFDRAGMLIQNGRASVLGYALSGINGGIKDLGHHHPVLEIDGAGQGSLAELLQFMRSSPLAEWTGHALSQATATGSAALKLSLNLPLDDTTKSGVKGSVLLQGNDVRIRADVPMLENARARVEFDRNGVSVRGGQARALGGDLAFEGGTQRDGSLHFTGTGRASAEGLRRAVELPAAPRLAQLASGQAPYQLQLGFNHGQAEIGISSSLAGMALDLPAPLRKEAESSLPLRVQITPTAPGRDDLRVELGSLLQLQYLRDTGGEAARVLRGALAVQDRLPPLPESGVQMQANLGKVNLDAWRATLQRLGGGGGDGPDPGAAAALSYVPNQIGLRAQSLLLSGRELAHLVAGITHATDGSNSWRFSVDADQLSGFIELRPPQSGAAAPAGRITARLARLSLPKQEAESVTQMLDSQPGSVPSLDIVVDAFELRGQATGAPGGGGAGQRPGARGPRLAPHQAAPGAPAGRAERHRRMAEGRARRGPAPHAIGLAARGRRCRPPAGRPGPGPDPARRPGRAGWPDRLARLAAVAGLPEHGRRVPRHARCRAVPEGRARRRPAAGRAEPAVAAAPAAARLPRRVLRRLLLRRQSAGT